MEISANYQLSLHIIKFSGNHEDNLPFQKILVKTA